jgi:hypothetical protein
MKFDLDFERQVFKFPTYNQIAMCKQCHARKRGAPLYSDIGPHAAWRLHPRTQAEYILSQGNALSNLAQIPGWSLELHRGDLMHVVFLGFGNHLLGSVILQLAKEVRWPGANLRERLVSAWTVRLAMFQAGMLEPWHAWQHWG